MSEFGLSPVKDIEDESESSDDEPLPKKTKADKEACPKCQKLVCSTSLKRHLKDHQENETDALEPCPKCNTKMRPRKLRWHVKRCGKTDFPKGKLFKGNFRLFY